MKKFYFLSVLSIAFILGTSSTVICMQDESKTIDETNHTKETLLFCCDGGDACGAAGFACFILNRSERGIQFLCKHHKPKLVIIGGVLAMTALFELCEHY